MDSLFYVFAIPFAISLFLFSRRVWTKEFLSDRWGVLVLIALLAVVAGCLILGISLFEGWITLNWGYID